jgi:release factor glutamine methyltransferase
MGVMVDAPGVVQAQITVGALLRELISHLASSETIDQPAAEARELLTALLGVQRSWPRLNAGAKLDDVVCERARLAAAKRVRGAPLAYCVGKAAFRHLTLDVDERVLIPRPETEQLVDVAMSMLGAAPGGVAVDVGTGSGAVALALATEACFERVLATDLSLDALAIARRNAERYRDKLRSPVEFCHGSLLAPLGDVEARLIVSNPPYIANSEATALPGSVRDWEPPIALFSGADGLDVTARLVREAAARLESSGVLALEVDSRRASAVAALVRADPRLGDVTVANDLAGRERFVVARRKEDG